MKTKEKYCKWNPMYMIFDENTDEWILLEGWYICSCLNNLCDCCCDVNINDIANGIHIVKVFWRSF